MELEYQSIVAMERTSLRIPAATLRLLIGEGSLLTSSFRRTLIERIWRCGCLANYTLTDSEYVQWTPCQKHRLSTPDEQS